ncbi:hypothetical protein ONS95_011423 [Cadophora gregata]|uniref:uncharacterized protein n=1 Tax=Cadophora gregata TaxID=51156 RepID=UPI0026DAAE78|nr:uncharacterized protein ONS95_011423 [Cadophora gregata]KAK0120005.1 hypothetical protein ONS95_011423 [Cadophora gregata]KAK0121040.1 hypothetical protein ONS96_011227 [Cadophora gregata f. sp. sojae]
MSSFNSTTSNPQKTLRSSSSSFSEENIGLPDYAQNSLQHVDLPVLTLISHGHAPPLDPQPQLRFDVRNLPNPPKHIRDAFNGTSRRLQEWMLSDTKFCGRRDAIRIEIEVEITKMNAEREQNAVLKSRHDAERDLGEAQGETQIEMNFSADQPEDGDAIPSGMDSRSEKAEWADPSRLRVGISCAMGRHRSVAMVEELAKMSWPGWQVELQHRDLNNKPGSGRKAGAKKSRGTRGGGIPSYFEFD